MDMKRILQAMDIVTNKPVEGADSMAKFLRVVDEATINQPTTKTLPAKPASDLTADEMAAILSGQKTQAQVMADRAANKKETILDEPVALTINPDSAGADTDRINTAQDVDPNAPPGFSDDDDDWDPDSPDDAEHVKSVEIMRNRSANGQDTTDYDRYHYSRKNDGKPGVWTKNDQPATVRESMDKFLAIVKKNDVRILNEGAGPHRVALPVQMAMQHYQQAESTTSSEPSLLKKYFHEVESEVNEQAKAKRQLVNQYASVIAERVMKKQSKNKVLNEDESDDESERRRFPHYYKHKERTIFRIPDESNPNGYRDVRPEDDEWDSIYQQEFDMPSPKEKGGFYIGNHPLVKGSDDYDQEVGEMAIAHNPDDANNPMIHGHEKANAMNLKDRIAQARAQLKELAQLADSNELVVWEKITRLSKGGMFMGLEQNLEQIRHGINELVQARKTGKQFPPKARGAIDKNIG
jgi:hypothetical protein